MNFNSTFSDGSKGETGVPQVEPYGLVQGRWVSLEWDHAGPHRHSRFLPSFYELEVLLHNRLLFSFPFAQEKVTQHCLGMLGTADGGGLCSHLRRGQVNHHTHKPMFFSSVFGVFEALLLNISKCGPR